MAKQTVKMEIFALEKYLPDVKNLILPLDTTLFVFGLNRNELIACARQAKIRRSFKLLQEYGIVMVVVEGGNKLIKVAGAEAIDEFLSKYFAQTGEKREVFLES